MCDSWVGWGGPTLPKTTTPYYGQWSKPRENARASEQWSRPTHSRLLSHAALARLLATPLNGELARRQKTDSKGCKSFEGQTNQFISASRGLQLSFFSEMARTFARIRARPAASTQLICPVGIYFFRSHVIDLIWSSKPFFCSMTRFFFRLHTGERYWCCSIWQVAWLKSKSK